MDTETQIDKKTQLPSFFIKYCVFVFLCSFIFSPPFSVSAQTNDFGSNIGVDLSKEINNSLSLGFSQELRFYQNSTHYSRSSTTVDIDYSFLKKYAKFGLSYCFLNKENKDYDYENQHRFSAQLTFKRKLGKFKLSWRWKFQDTYRNENIGDYKVNPKYYFRDKVQLNYKFTNSRFTPALSCELFCFLNDPDQNRIDKIRTTLGFDYVLSRRASVEVFGRLDKDVQVKNPLSLYSFGLFYKYSL